MHPTIYHELTRLKIADELAYAERQRLANAARRDSVRPIDFASAAGRIRVRVRAWRAGRPNGPLPAGA